MLAMTSKSIKKFWSGKETSLGGGVTGEDSIIEEIESNNVEAR